MTPLALRHLEKANAYRHDKAEIRHALKAGRMSLDALFADVPPCCQKMPAFEILQWLPRVRYHTAKKISKGVISETLPLSHLSEQTKVALLARVKTRGKQ